MINAEVPAARLAFSICRILFTSQGASVVAGASEKKEKSDLAGSYDELIWHTTRGQALIHKQQWKAALIEWQYVCNAEPNDVLGLSNIAGAWLTLGISMELLESLPACSSWCLTALS